MWILTGSEPLEIHSYFSSHILFVVDLQYITTRKVKSGCALHPKLRPQSRESEPNSHESVALFRVIFQYNGRTGYPVCLTRRESEPVCRKFTALSLMIRTTTWHYRALQGTYAGELPENREEGGRGVKTVGVCKAG